MGQGTPQSQAEGLGGVGHSTGPLNRATQYGPIERWPGPGPILAFLPQGHSIGPVKISRGLIRPYMA